MKKATFTKLLTLALALVATGCGRSTEPNFEYLQSLSMMDGKSVKTTEEDQVFPNGNSMRPPVEGTLARGQTPYPYAKTDDAGTVGKNFTNPLARTKEVLARGQAMYNIYCIVCHGPKGKSDGTIIPKFPMPPSLHSDKVRNWGDGSIYHVISAGQNLMPSYASQIDPADRWAIVHYVRALQLAVNPK